MRHRDLLLLTAVLAAVLAACTAASDDGTVPDDPRDASAAELPAAPPAPDGPLDPDLDEQLDGLVADPVLLTRGDVDAVAEAEDVRAAWVLVDLLRFQQGGPLSDRVEGALVELTGLEPTEDLIPWVVFSDALLTWDVPAPPDYLDRKRAIYLAYDGTWAPFFDDDADLDWREVTWGGVVRDGIEALDHPSTVAANDADHLDDDDIVFGVLLDGAARAYPRRILEVHEMANDTLGGRRIALSYCTLCGSPIPYDVEGVDEVGEPLELRTTGLLQRSNKLMYDTQTESMFDQFRGDAVTGPLRAAAVALEPLPIVVTTWAEWRNEHPGTDVVDIPDPRGPELDLEHYPGDLAERRDADGPIFPTGQRDDRLDPQIRVLGVTTPRGASVAFPVEEARAELDAGGTVRAAGVELRRDDGGLVAHPVDGGPQLPAHEAYWFAWSQFRPDTALWQR